jgi:hypothetical protein
VDQDREDYDDVEWPDRLPSATLSAVLALAGISIGLTLVTFVCILTRQ